MQLFCEQTQLRNVTFKLWQILEGERVQMDKKQQLSTPNLTVVAALGSILQTVFRLQHKQFWSSCSRWSKHLLIQIYLQLLPKKKQSVDGVKKKRNVPNDWWPSIWHGCLSASLCDCSFIGSIWAQIWDSGHYVDLLTSNQHRCSTKQALSFLTLIMDYYHCGMNTEVTESSANRPLHFVFCSRLRRMFFMRFLAA